MQSLQSAAWRSRLTPARNHPYPVSLTRLLPVLLLFIASSMRALGVAAAVNQALPRIDDWAVSNPMAAVCQDGTIWVSWLQSLTREAGDWGTSHVDAELCCALIDRNGTDVVPKMSARLWLDAGVLGRVNPAYMCANPDGNAVIFTRRGSEYHESLDVTLVTRTGSATSVELAACFPAGRGWQQTRSAMRESGVGPFQVCFAPDGAMHCFFWSRRRLTHMVFTTAEGNLRVAQTEDYYPFGRPKEEPQLDTAMLRLVKLALPDDRARTFFVAPDTIVTVFTDLPRTDDRIQAGSSTELKTYRFALPSLIFCGSVLVPCAEVAGADLPGVAMAGTMVARTENGLVFYVPASGRAESYRLSSTGAPCVGARETGRAQPFEPSRKYIGERIDVLWFGKGKSRNIEWKGVGESGQLHSEVLVRDRKPDEQD
jgi:hypothetical protein